MIGPSSPFGNADHLSSMIPSSDTNNGATVLRSNHNKLLLNSLLQLYTSGTYHFMVEKFVISRSLGLSFIGLASS